MFFWVPLLLSAGAARVISAQSLPSNPSSPVTLRQVLTETVRSYPLVHAAEARVQAAQGSRRTAGRFENPLLDYIVENAELPGGSKPAMEREAMLMATLPLQPLYQRWPRVRRADSELSAARAEAAGQRQQIALAAAGAFYRTAFAQIKHETAHDLVTWLDSVVAYNRVRAHEGVAAEADLIRSELERDQAAAEEALHAAELVRARAELRVFAEITGNLTFDPGPFLLAASAQSDSDVIVIRPDVRSARQKLQAAQAGVRVERTMVFPDIGATVGLKQSAGTTSLIAGINAPFPLFNQNRGEIQRAAAERDVAAFELAAVERAALAQLAGAREAARVLTERARALANGFLARADEARSIALGAYREGAVPLLQVIDASRAWGAAQRIYHETLFAQHESVLALLAAQGSDLSDISQLKNR